MSQAKRTAPKADSYDKEIIFRESFVFVLDLISYTEQLRETGKELMPRQILKSGITFGEIINEMRLTSNLDKSKLKKLIKIATYIKYLLQLCKYSESYPNPNNLISDLDQIKTKISSTELSYIQ